MITQDILLNRLKHHFGVTGKVLDWIRSYSMQWELSIIIGWWKISSNYTETRCTTRQCPWTSPLYPIYITTWRLMPSTWFYIPHGYADDSQNYLIFQPSVKGSREQCTEVLNNCIQNIRVWMPTNFLKFNDEKAEFIMFGTKPQLSKVP